MTNEELRDALDRSTDDHGEVCKELHVVRAQLRECRALLATARAGNIALLDKQEALISRSSVAESERDTALADLADMTRRRDNLSASHGLPRVQDVEEIAALQAKVSRAVERLQERRHYEQMMPVKVADAALEALR